MKFRSSEWFGRKDRDGFIHRSWMKNQGFPDHLFDGRPVIGICNTWSELTPCNAHFRKLAEYVKRGVYEARGFPLEFPVMSPVICHRSWLRKTHPYESGVSEKHWMKRPLRVMPQRLEEGITIRNSPMSEIHPVLSTNVTVRDVKKSCLGVEDLNNSSCINSQVGKGAVIRFKVG